MNIFSFVLCIGFFLSQQFKDISFKQRTKKVLSPLLTHINCGLMIATQVFWYITITLAQRLADFSFWTDLMQAFWPIFLLLVNSSSTQNFRSLWAKEKSIFKAVQPIDKGKFIALFDYYEKMLSIVLSNVVNIMRKWLLWEIMRKWLSGNFDPRALEVIEIPSEKQRNTRGRWLSSSHLFWPLKVASFRSNEPQFKLLRILFSRQKIMEWKNTEENRKSSAKKLRSLLS